MKNVNRQIKIHKFALIILVVLPCLINNCTFNQNFQINTNQKEETKTIGSNQSINANITPTIKNTELVESQLTEYQKITSDNIADLKKITEQEFDELYLGSDQIASNNRWLNDNQHFLIPIIDENGLNIQIFSTRTLTRQKTEMENLGIFDVVNDQIYFYDRGLFIYYDIEKRASMIKCDSNYGTGVDFQYLTAIPEKNLVLSGHNKYADFLESYGTSTILLWDMINNSCRIYKEDFPGRITSLSASKDGNYFGYSVLWSDIESILSNGIYSTVHIIDLATESEICTIKGHDLLFTNDDNLIVYDFTSQNNSVLLYSYVNCSKEREFSVGDEVLSGFAVSYSGELFSAVDTDHLKIYEIETGTKIFDEKLPTKSGTISIINFSLDDKFLIVGLSNYSSDKTDRIILWGIHK